MGGDSWNNGEPGACFLGAFQDAGGGVARGWVGEFGIKGCLSSREAFLGEFHALGGHCDEVVPEFEGRGPVEGARYEAVDDVPADMLTGLVAVGVGCGGVVYTQA
jgi:hypothetical protein